MALGGIAQEISSDLHSMIDTTTIYRKILESARHHREKRQWYSERSFSFPLVVGKWQYSLGEGPPKEMVEVVGKTLWLLYGGSQNDRSPIVRVSTNEFEATRQWGTSQSQPNIWDFWNKQLRFYPQPISATDVVEGRYVVDLGVPVVKWVNAAFAFYMPDQVTQLTTAELDSFDSDLFNERGGYHMVRLRAMYLLYRDVLKDSEAAQNALSGWLEAVALLDEETEHRNAGALEIAGTILGDGDGVYEWWS